MVILVNLSISPLVAALRVHAVSGGSWRWVLPVWLLGMVPVGTNGWLLAQETWLVTPQLGCVSIVSISRAKYDAMAVATRASVLLSDILLVAATWYYLSRTSSVAEQLQPSSNRHGVYNSHHYSDDEHLDFPLPHLHPRSRRIPNTGIQLPVPVLHRLARQLWPTALAIQLRVRRHRQRIWRR